MNALEPNGVADGGSSQRRHFVCLGRVERCETEWREPDRYRDLFRFPAGRRHIVRGGGLSLAGASFGDGVLVTGMRRFNRILAFDAGAMEIRAEGGATLGALFSFLGARGLRVPVQPGYPDITLGGCIAANAHGKNPYRDGIFADIVREIELFHPARGSMRLSRGENSELFEATCGGFGLTGLIVSATLRLKPAVGRRARIRYTRVRSLDESMERLKAMCEDSDVLYGWNDLGSFGGRGAGFVVAGTFIPDGDSGAGSDAAAYRPLRPEARPLPFNAYTRLGIAVLNGVYAALNGRVRKQRVVEQFEVLFPFATRERYFRAYGPRGFVEHQVLISHDMASRYFHAFERLARDRRATIGLATLKLFRGPRKFLWFSGSGVAFAFHVAATPANLDFLSRVDRLDIEHGAIANVIKDSRLPSEAVRRQFPEFDVFRDTLAAHDPDRVFASTLSRRIGL